MAAPKAAIAQGGVVLGCCDPTKVEAAIEAWARAAVVRPLPEAAAEGGVPQSNGAGYRPHYLFTV